MSGINLQQPCTTARPTTIVTFHGTADPIVPYDGGAVFSGLPGGVGKSRFDALLTPAMKALFARVPLAPVETAVSGWAQVFGCGAPTDSSVATDVRLRSYGDCRGGVAVELYTVTGGGHTWPGAFATGRKDLGATTESISATQIIVKTVDALHTRP